MTSTRRLFLYLAGGGGAAFGQLDKILGRIGKGSQSPGADKIALGLKEALSIGTDNAIKLTGVTDGYFKNELIKILLPEKMRSMEKGLRMVGAGPKIDEFVMSMNRAAEKAAPVAKSYFKDAILSMTIEDAKGILTGGDTSATDFFKNKTSAKLTTAFRPHVETAMNEFGVTKQFNSLMGQARKIPFMKSDFADIEGYVVGKALDGLFLMVGQEERKIRKDPAARVTGLLKDVFGSLGKSN